MRMNQIATCLWIIMQLPFVLHGDKIDIANKDPIVFGGNVTLECFITNQMDMTHVAWLKGEYGDVLTRTYTSSNTTKYVATMTATNGTGIYQLTINNLDEFDVNTEYRCTYGFKSLSFILSTTHHAFIYIPNRRDVLTTIDMKNAKINISIVILRIYPEPTCILLYEGKSLNTEPVVTIKQQTLFYEVTMGVWSNMQDDKCQGTVSLQCKIREYDIDIVKRKINYCEDLNDTNIPVWTAGVIIAITVIAVVCVIIILKTIRRDAFTSCRNTKNRSNNVNIDTGHTLLNKDDEPMNNMN